VNLKSLRLIQVKSSQQLGMVMTLRKIVRIDALNLSVFAEAMRMEQDWKCVKGKIRRKKSQEKSLEDTNS
jgi:hypothetical protein